MNFFITILGSGAATPTHVRHCSSQVVNINGFRMLLDCGESTQNQLRQYHQKMQAMGVIFISHLHGDHLFGLPGLLASMHLCGRQTPVDIYSPRGLQHALDVLFNVSDTHLQYELRIHELDLNVPTEIFRNDRCKVTAFPLIHTVPTYGFLFEEVHDLLNLKRDARTKYNLTPDQCIYIKQGHDLTLDDGTVIPCEKLTLPPKTPRRYAYCCDTAYSETLIPIIQGVNLLCMESTFDMSRTNLAGEKLHCTAQQSALLAQKANVKQLVLTHFSARYKDITPLVEEAKTVYPNVIPATDGEVIEIK